MRKLIAVLVFLASIAAAAWGTYALIASGINNLNDGFNANPNQVGTIVKGFLEVLVAWEGYAFVIIVPGTLLAAAIGGFSMRNRRHRRRGFSQHGGVPMKPTGRWPGM